MPGRIFNLGGYRYGFNGKENDSEVKGQGNQQDYGMRIYDPRIGRFLSVDPISNQYPHLTPYQYASNRVIDGVDLDGLEFLKAENALVEFRRGVLQLKISNLSRGNLGAYLLSVRDPNNWTYTNGVKDIGIDPTIFTISNDIANVSFTKNTPSQPPTVMLKDIPGSDLPSSAVGQTESGVQSVGVNRSARREIARNGPIVNVSPKVGGGKGAAILDFVNFGIEQYLDYVKVADGDRLEEHKQFALSAMGNVIKAKNDGLVPKKYQNKSSLISLMNVVLQGKNNTDDKEIYNLGMRIYNQYNPKPKVTIVPSGLDDNKGKTYDLTKKP